MMLWDWLGWSSSDISGLPALSGHGEFRESWCVHLEVHLAPAQGVESMVGQAFECGFKGIARIRLSAFLF